MLKRKTVPATLALVACIYHVNAYSPLTSQLNQVTPLGRSSIHSSQFSSRSSQSFSSSRAVCTKQNKSSNSAFLNAARRITTSSSSCHLSSSDRPIPDLFLEEEGPFGGMKPQVFPQRWVQLGYLSALALLSDWICFSVAASPSTFEAAYPGHSAANLIDMFLFTNVASCFLVTDIVSKFGLSKAIKSASILMTLGCILRSGVPNLGAVTSALHMSSSTADAVASSSHLVSYPLIVAGTILVGAAQPFFQCTPPMLSATWFASDERATSTAVALNFNQIGIATAFLVGGAMASDVNGLAGYFTLITAISLAITAGTLLQFQEKPPVPPSSSEIEKLIKGEKEPPFIESVKKFFSTPGFTGPLAAFICSISITNIVGAFIDEVLERGGITNQFTIDLTGAGFELAILVGGIIIGGYVDKTKKYKDVTLACLLTTIFLVVPLGLTDHALGKEPILLILSLLGLGVAAGPIQPINAELAVDVTYPSDETAVESVQQIGGNLVSALLVPVAELAAKQDYQLLPSVKTLASDVRGDVLLLMGLAVITFVYFQSFDAPLKRSIADCADDGTCPIPRFDDSVIDTSATTVLGKTSSPTITPEQQEMLNKLR